MNTVEAEGIYNDLELKLGGTESIVEVSGDNGGVNPMDGNTSTICDLLLVKLLLAKLNEDEKQMLLQLCSCPCTDCKFIGLPKHLIYNLLKQPANPRTDLISIKLLYMSYSQLQNGWDCAGFHANALYIIPATDTRPQRLRYALALIRSFANTNDNRVVLTTSNKATSAMLNNIRHDFCSCRMPSDEDASLVTNTNLWQTVCQRLVTGRTGQPQFSVAAVMACKMLYAFQQSSMVARATIARSELVTMFCEEFAKLKGPPGIIEQDMDRILHLLHDTGHIICTGE